MENPKWEAPSSTDQVPTSIIPRRVLGVSQNTQGGASGEVSDESLGREQALVGWVQVNFQRTPYILRPYHQSGINRGVQDFEAHRCVFGTSRDLIGPSRRDLLLGVGVNCDESEVGFNGAGGCSDVDDGSNVNTSGVVDHGGIADHGDVRVDGSRPRLENKPFRGGEVSADWAIGNFEFAIFAFDVCKMPWCYLGFDRQNVWLDLEVDGEVDLHLGCIDDHLLHFWNIILGSIDGDPRLSPFAFPGILWTEDSYTTDGVLRVLQRAKFGLFERAVLDVEVDVSFIHKGIFFDKVHRSEYSAFYQNEHVVLV